MVKRNKIPGFLSNLIKKEEESRYANMLYIAVIFLCLLSLRIFYMQILKGSYYKSESDGNRMRQIPVQAARGVMYDRNGKIMAGSRSAYSIILSDVNKDKDIPEIELNRLASLLNISASEIKEKISKNKKSFGEIVIARDVGIDVATQIEERRDEYPNFNIEVY
ncbi:MAG: penicillin-binding protein 2, partial [Dialister pneumosintes]